MSRQNQGTFFVSDHRNNFNFVWHINKNDEMAIRKLHAVQNYILNVGDGTLNWQELAGPNQATRNLTIEKMRKNFGSEDTKVLQLIREWEVEVYQRSRNGVHYAKLTEKLLQDYKKIKNFEEINEVIQKGLKEGQPKSKPKRRKAERKDEDSEVEKEVIIDSSVAEVEPVEEVRERMDRVFDEMLKGNGEEGAKELDKISNGSGKSSSELTRESSTALSAFSDVDEVDDTSNQQLNQDLNLNLDRSNNPFINNQPNQLIGEAHDVMPLQKQNRIVEENNCHKSQTETTMPESKIEVTGHDKELIEPSQIELVSKQQNEMVKNGNINVAQRSKETPKVGYVEETKSKFQAKNYPTSSLNFNPLSGFESRNWRNGQESEKDGGNPMTIKQSQTEVGALAEEVKEGNEREQQELFDREKGTWRKISRAELLSLRKKGKMFVLRSQKK